MTLNKMMNLRGRRVLVTGATGHLGQEICKTVAELGADILLLDLPNSNFKKLANYLTKKYKIKCMNLACDLEFEDDRSKTIKIINSQVKNLNIIINNAAFVGSSNLPGWATAFKNQNLNTWRRAIEVNLTAVFHLCQGLYPKIKNANGANILNIGSIYGTYGPDWRIYKNTGMGNPAAYGASKGGLDQLTKWLATTMAPNVRVNTLVSGGISRSQPKRFKKRSTNPLSAYG